MFNLFRNVMYDRNNKRFQQVNATAIRVCCKWNPPDDEDRMRTGLTNAHMARGFSVLYHVFARKHVFSVLHYVIKVTLHYHTLHRFEIHSALELSCTSSRGYSLTIRTKRRRGCLLEMSFTRGSYYRGLRAKSLVFWIGGRLWEVVAYERCSHMEVRLYLLSENIKFLLTCDSFSVKAWTSSSCFCFIESSFSCHSCSVSKRADSTLMALSARKLAVSSFNSSWWEDSSCDFTAPMTSRWRSLKSEKEQKTQPECTVKRSNLEKKFVKLSFGARFKFFTEVYYSTHGRTNMTKP